MCGIYSTINKRVQLVLVAAGLTLAKFRSDQIGKARLVSYPQTPTNSRRRCGGSVLDKDLLKGGVES